MPAAPEIFYKDHGWPGWNTIFGKKKVPFKEFLNRVRKAGIKSSTEYQKWRKKHLNMPANPAQFYKVHGWLGWNTIFGKKKIPKAPFE